MRNERVWLCPKETKSAYQHLQNSLINMLHQLSRYLYAFALLCWLTELLLRTGQSVSPSASCWGPRSSPLVSPSLCHHPRLHGHRRHTDTDTVNSPELLKATAVPYR